MRGRAIERLRRREADEVVETMRGVSLFRAGVHSWRGGCKLRAETQG